MKKLGLIVLLGWLGSSLAAAPEVFFLSLTRDICLAAYPVYEISVDQNGLVRWNGKMRVAKKGKATTRVSAARVEKIKVALVRFKFWNLKNEYLERAIKGQPSVTIRVRSGDRLKAIEHHFGDRSAPKLLTQLEDELDVLLETKKWVGRGARR